MDFAFKRLSSLKDNPGSNDFQRWMVPLKREVTSLTKAGIMLHRSYGSVPLSASHDRTFCLRSSTDEGRREKLTEALMKRVRHILLLAS